MQVDPRILKAERLRAIQNMPEYHATIGAWIDEAFKEALHNLSIAVEVHEVHRAQGAFTALTSFKDNFDKVFQAEDAAVEKKLKKTARVLTGDRR